MNEDMEKTIIADAGEAVLEPEIETTQLAANVDCPVCHTPNPPSETYCIDCGFLLAEEPVAVEEMPEVEPVGKLITTSAS